MSLRTFILQTILLVGLFACADKTTNKSLDFSDPHWMDDFDVVLLVTSDDEDVSVFVMARGIPDLDFLNINGDTIPVLIYYDEDRNLSYFVNYDDDTVIDPGSPFDFEMAIGGVLYSGSLTMPPELSVEWPLIFSTNEDFQFWWEIAENPDAFIVTATLYDSDDDELDYDVWQVDGNLRSFVISRGFFHGYSEDDVSFDAEIHPTNFSISEDFVVMGSSDYEYYESWMTGEVTHSKKKRKFPGFPTFSGLTPDRQSIRSLSAPGNRAQ